MTLKASLDFYITLWSGLTGLGIKLLKFVYLINFETIITLVQELKSAMT